MDENTIKTLMSSENTDWETPDDLFDILDELFGFELDVCATKKNRKVKKYYSIKDNAFNQKWIGSCWMNPPYGKSENPCEENCKKKTCKKRGHHIGEYIPGVEDWVKKAIDESRSGSAMVVCLLPARTDTDWFQHIWDNSDILVFIKGRLKFKGADCVAPFPSVISVLSNFELNIESCETLCLLGNVFFNHKKFDDMEDFLTFIPYHFHNINKRRLRFKKKISSVEERIKDDFRLLKEMKRKLKEMK